MSRLKIALAALALPLALAACSSQSFQPGRTLPAAPPAPPQPPPPPYNPARHLDGLWSATYPGGPLRVTVAVNPMLMGRNYVATLVDGNANIPAGQVVWRGTPDANVPGLIPVNQICADQGFLMARWISARISVQDSDHFTEDLVRPQDCHGFPVLFTRIGPPPRKTLYSD
ncbi:MAG TPA: hypothetical protein VMU16_11705 [Candidatus Binataceae bacterium]|nr:hypothetical protein [Candidatus Binataceae bacterium]